MTTSQCELLDSWLETSDDGDNETDDNLISTNDACSNEPHDEIDEEVLIDADPDEVELVKGISMMM